MIHKTLLFVKSRVFLKLAHSAGFENKTTVAPVVLIEKGAGLPVCEPGNAALQADAIPVTAAS